MLQIEAKNRHFAAVFSAVAVSFSLLIGSSQSCQAVAIDLSLNVQYTDPAVPTSGGTWQLAAKTDEMGLQSLTVLLQGIQFDSAADITQLAPAGVVNGVNPAGFRDPPAAANFPLGYTSVTVFQAPIVFPEGESGEQSYFYGVGSIVDDGGQGGAPNYPAQQTDFPDTTSIGPEISSLANLSGVPWGNGDFLMDTDWASAAILLSGTFLAGQQPSFFNDGEGLNSKGRVFTTVPGTATALGNVSATIDATTIIRTNFQPIPGDYNLDGTVNLHDYTLWRDALGETVTPGSGADGMADGLIDEADYDVWKTNFGTTSGAGALTGPSGAPVPEPRSLFVMTIAAAILIAFRVKSSVVRPSLVAA